MNSRFEAGRKLTTQEKSALARIAAAEEATPVDPDKLWAAKLWGHYRNKSRNLAARLGKEVGRLRQALGVTQVDVARAIGTKQPAVSRIESGRYDGITLERILSIIFALAHIAGRDGVELGTAAQQCESGALASLVDLVFRLNQEEITWTHQTEGHIEPRQADALQKAGTVSAQAICDALGSIFSGIQTLRTEFPAKAFTIDGRLVGDIGEIIATLEYDFELNQVFVRGYDGHTSDGRRVQVKATFKDSLTFSTVPDYYLCFKLFSDGRYQEIYNGPGQRIFDRFSHRKGIGQTLLSFPIRVLTELAAEVPPDKRVPRRPAEVGGR